MAAVVLVAMLSLQQDLPDPNWGQDRHGLNALFRLPDKLGDEIIRLFPLGANPDPDAPLAFRIFELEVYREPLEYPFPAFLAELIQEERKLITKLEWEETYGRVDMGEFWNRQKDVIEDVFRDVYWDRYHLVGVEKIIGDRLSIDDWKGIDFVALPVIIGSYGWLKGLRTRLRIGDHKFRLRVEAFSDIKSALRDNDRHPAMGGIEWEIPRLPFKFIAALGIDDGNVELDFVGIATDFGMVKRLIK